MTEGMGDRNRVASNRFSSLGPKQPTPGARQRGWLKELTGLFEEIVQELTHLANINCQPALFQGLCSALTEIPGCREGGLACRWDEGSTKLQMKLGTELEF